MSEESVSSVIFPTSADIYIEVEGKKVAVVQSYSVSATRSGTVVEAFGQDEPVATLGGSRQYVIQLSRIYATDEAISDGINFYDLDSFYLVICKPDKRVIFADCRWAKLEETGTLGQTVMEKVKVVASRRFETTAD